MEGPYIAIIWCQYLFVAVYMVLGERRGERESTIKGILVPKLICCLNEEIIKFQFAFMQIEDSNSCMC